MTLYTYRIFHISDDPADINNMQLCCQGAADADLGFKMWCGKDDDGHITRWLAKDEAARVTSLNISGLTAIASLVKTDGAGNLSAGQISIATLNSFLSDGPIPTCPVITAGQVVYGGGSAGTPITSKSSFFFDSANNYLGIGHATPDCGIHVGANNPTYSSGGSDGFITGDLEVTNIDLINAIRMHGLTAGSIPYLAGSPPATTEANSNLYYTEDTLGLKVTPTDDDAQIDIIAAPVFSAAGGGATINITATSSGAHFGNINIDSSGDALLHASNDLTMRAGATSKSAIFMNPDTEDSIRFQTPYTYSSWVKTYLPLAETQTEEATYVGNFGEASILDAMNQLYTLASGGGSLDMDDTYNNGHSITADSGAVAITVPDASSNPALAITQNEGDTQYGMTISTTGGASAVKAAIKIDTGGKEIDGADIELWNTGIYGHRVWGEDELLIAASDDPDPSSATNWAILHVNAESSNPYARLAASYDGGGYDGTVTAFTITATGAAAGYAYFEETDYIDFNDAGFRDIGSVDYGAEFANTVSSNDFDFSPDNGIIQKAVISADSTWSLNAPSTGKTTRTNLTVENSDSSDHTLTLTGSPTVTWYGGETDGLTIPASSSVLISVVYRGSTPGWQVAVVQES